MLPDILRDGDVDCLLFNFFTFFCFRFCFVVLEEWRGGGAAGESVFRHHLLAGTSASTGGQKQQMPLQW